MFPRSSGSTSATSFNIAAKRENVVSNSGIMESAEHNSIGAILKIQPIFNKYPLDTQPDDLLPIKKETNLSQDQKYTDTPRKSFLEPEQLELQSDSLESMQSTFDKSIKGKQSCAQPKLCHISNPVELVNLNTQNHFGQEEFLEKSYKICQNEPEFKAIPHTKHFKELKKSSKFNEDLLELPFIKKELDETVIKSEHFLTSPEYSHDLIANNCSYTWENSEADNLNYLQYNQPDILVSNQVFCGECNRGFSSKRTLSYHVGTVHKEKKSFMCCKCNRAFTVKGSLIRHIQVVHENVKKYACDVCNRFFSSKVPLSNHIDSAHLKIKRYNCGKCYRLFSTNDYLKFHTASVHENVENRHYCKVCNRSFSHKNSLRRHFANYHVSNPLNWINGEMQTNLNELGTSLFSLDDLETGNLNYRQYNKSDNSITNDITCRECDRGFSSRKNLAYHIGAVHKTKKTFACSTCSREFTVKQSLIRHIQFVHENIKKYVCNECDLSFSTKLPLSNHIDSVHLKIKRFPCKQCDQLFSTFNDLKFHMASVHENIEYPNFCRECNRSFSHKNSLKRHRASYHIINPLNREKGTSKCLISGYNKNFMCNFCDGAFYRRDLLERHILKTHKNLSKEQLKNSLFSVQELYQFPRKYKKREKEHVCKDCNRAYCSEKALTYHIANHKKDENNFCAECQRSFAHKWNLKSHIEAFHSMKYPCDLCSVTFTRHLDLKKHVRVHKNIICLECNLKFSHSWKYTKHFDNVHREKSFKCHTCDKGFSHKCYLKRHIQDVHLNVRNFECVECNRKFCRRSGLVCHMNTRHRHLFTKLLNENPKL